MEYTEYEVIMPNGIIALARHSEFKYNSIEYHAGFTNQIINEIMTTKQVKTKEEFQAKHAQEKKDFLNNKKRKNPNHVVTPNLTPRGRDIKMRLQNKSLDTEGERSYTLNEDIVNTRFMSKHELKAAAEANQKKINSIQENLKSNASKQEKSKAEAAKKEVDEMKKLHSQIKPESNG